MTDEMRIHSFTTCVDSHGYVIGLQFSLTSNPYSADEDSEAIIELGAIGNMNGDCTTLTLEGGFDKIRAYESEYGVRNLRFYREDRAKTYGKLKDEFTEWLFTNETPLVGLYGRQSTNGIEELGFITLDTACQGLPNEVPEEVTVEPVSPEQEPSLETIIKEESDGLLFGFDRYLNILIGVAIVVFTILIFVAIYACKIKKNFENKIVMVTSPTP